MTDTFQKIIDVLRTHPLGDVAAGNWPAGGDAVKLTAPDGSRRARAADPNDRASVAPLDEGEWSRRLYPQ